ncbi:MAG: DUF655 domain-containing protein [Promethearchaeia archaeon]|nr:MAG: DUF655 domain-containing protein [Candidatus Lokiarchaeia archaeon]
MVKTEMDDPERSYPPRRGKKPYPRRSSYKPKFRGPRRAPHRRSSRPTVYIRKGTLVYLLDILQHGGVDTAGHSWHPIGQVIEIPTFRLLEVNLNKKLIPELKVPQKIIYEGTEESPLGRANKILQYDDLTPTSVTTLVSVVETYVQENEEKFVHFVNTAGPITLKRHSLEVLPGVGKKLMWEIINYREKHPFRSFKEIHENVPGFKPVDIFTKRIIEEISDPDQKHFLFTRYNRRRSENQKEDHRRYQPRDDFRPRS